MTLRGSFKKEYPNIVSIPVSFEPLDLQAVGFDQQQAPRIKLNLAGLSVAAAMEFVSELASSHAFFITTTGFSFKGISATPDPEH